MTSDMDETEWQEVTLSEVAADINERVADPSKSGYERFVGLEHLISGDLIIKLWGSTDDVTSSMKLFRKGDVLFARRNTYLRRASMADFEGICSGDAYVLRANPDLLVDGYLPLILNTSNLWDYANAHSAGGMSKRAKWRDLEKYTFPLPPIDEQRRIAEILWAAEDVIVKNEAFVAEVEHYKQLMMRDLFSKGIGYEKFKEVKGIGVVPNEWKIVKLQNIVASDKPITYGIVQAGPNVDDGIPYVRTGDLNDSGIDISSLLKTSRTIAQNYHRSQINEGDILFSLRGDIGKTMIVPPKLDGANISRGVARLSCSKNCDNRFLNSVFKKPNIKNRLIAVSQGSTFNEISLSELKRIEIPLPSLPEQRQIAAILSSIDDAIAAARASVEASKALKMRLINQLLSLPAKDGS